MADHAGTTAPTGHIKLSRKAFDADRGDPFWLEPREFSRWEAWVDVIQLAAFRPGRFVTEHFGVVELARGEFVASLRWLAARFKWSLKRVRYWIATCEKGARLKAQRETPAGTVYLIVNYDAYQPLGHSKGTADDTAKGTAGAQQGHKIEEGKESKEVTTLSNSDADRVLAHYLTRHPRRRIGKHDRKAVTRALALGYAAQDLCDAIDGNATDAWHIGKRMHALTYVLRDTGKIDDFRAKLETAHQKSDNGVQRFAHLAGYPHITLDGQLTEYGERVTRPDGVKAGQYA